MNILVTGGAGFIASNVVDAYINDGHEVVVIDNLSTGRRENLNPKAKFYHVDICSDEVREIIEKEKPEILNHHAAQLDVRYSVANPVEDITINIIGFVNLLESARQNGLKKVVFASSGGVVYGEQKEFPATETHPNFPISPYGVDKLASEKYLYYYSVQYGIPFVALRYANIYGPRQNAHGEAGVVAIFTEKMLRGEEPIINGDGKQTRDYVYVGDVVKANLLALKNTPSPMVPARRQFGGGEGRPASHASQGEAGRGEGAIYNIGTGVETDVNQIFHSIREITKSSCSEKHGPAKPGEQERSVISSAKIERELGWKPIVSLSEGIKLTVEWFRKEKKG